MLRRVMIVVTLGVGIAIGSCDSPTGEGGVLGTEPIAGGSRAAPGARMALTTLAEVGTVGCVARGSGLLRVVRAEDACRDNEEVIMLGGGLMGYEIVTSDHIFEPGTQSSFGSSHVNCPVGKRVLGGGGAALVRFGSGPLQPGSSGAADFSSSFPVDEDTWRVSYDVTNASIVEGVRTFATCAY